MNRFFNQNLRFPLLFQLLSAAACIYLILLFFTHFVDKPRYEKLFFEFHISRSEPFVDAISESLSAEIIKAEGAFPVESFGQFDSRPGIAEALIIDCKGDVYISKNSAHTGNSILSSNTRSLSEGLYFLSPELFAQVATTGVSISRDLRNKKRFQLHSLPCIDQNNTEFQYSVLLVFFDWSEIVEENMSMVNGIMLNERFKWLFILVLICVALGLSVLPRSKRLREAISAVAAGNYDKTYDSQAFDELDVIGQSFDEAVVAFRKKITSLEAESSNLELGYAAFRHSDQAICILSDEQRVTDINSAYEELSGYTRNEMIGRSLLSILPDKLIPDDGSDFIEQYLLNDATHEVWGHKKNGARFRKAIRIISHSNSDGEIESYFLVERDITQMYEQREELKLLAETDPLTGIYNRRKFDSDLNTLRSQGKKNFAVGIINLDSMREINSEYGKRSGDTVITESGRRLLLAVSGSKNSVYRFEGDEFYVLFKDIESEEELEHQARGVLSSVVGEVNIADTSIEITAGMGVAVYDKSSREDSSLTLTHANLALRHAKTTGRSKVILAHDHVLSAERRKLSISLALKSSKLPEQLHLSYLPKIDIQHGILSGAEAIIRWEHPQLGYIPTEELLSVAQRTGDITRIDSWTIESALKNTAQFVEQIDGFQTAIKISSLQLAKKSFSSNFIRQIKSHGISPESIALEVTESAVNEHQETSITAIKRLRRAGISIHIEDFGFGYPSSSELQLLPLDALKINKTFLGKQPNSQAIRTILSLAKSMNIPVIAEGVESTYHLNLLKKMGCNFCQGYLYSEPVSLNQDTDAKSILSEWQKSIEAVMS